MEAQKNRILHRLLSELNLMEAKPDLVRSFTDDRTEHSSEMNNVEANLMIKWLQDRVDQKITPMRKKIIHLLCVFGMVKENGKPDYIRIDRFIQEIGNRNPKKKRLSYLSLKETHAVLNQVEVMVRKEINR